MQARENEVGFRIDERIARVFYFSQWEQRLLSEKKKIKTKHTKTRITFNTRLKISLHSASWSIVS